MRKRSVLLPLLGQYDMDPQALVPEMLESFSVIAGNVLAIFYP